MPLIPSDINKIILGDNLGIMRGMADECIDLIYLDPPFFSNRNYEVIWGDGGEIRSFQDRWAGGIELYIAWFKESASANSDAGIEFYSRDFSYNDKVFKPEVPRETDGRQRYKFKPGTHRIAVKVIDNEELEGLEDFTLTVNGRIKRSK